MKFIQSILQKGSLLTIFVSLTSTKVKMYWRVAMSLNLFNKEIKLKMGILAALVGTLIVSTGVIGFLLSRDESEIIVSKSEDTSPKNVSVSTPPETTNIAEQNEIVEEIKVYVVGEVNRPGVVTLKKGQIIEDAIKAAGGPTDKADMDNINLAYELQENVMLKIYPKSTAAMPDGDVKNQQTNASSDVPATSVAQEKVFTGMEIKSDSGGAVISDNNQEDTSKGKKGKININTATEEELDSLPGIGPSTAAKIVSFRENSGKFKKIEDIMNVPGIGESKFRDIKDFITVN